MARRLRMVLARVLNVPLFLISRLIPRDPRLWVFGAWFGQQYADNPRYLAEYIATKRPDLRAVWLADNDIALRAARRAGLRAHRRFSIQGYLATARAGAGIICTSSWDINHFVRPPVVLNTWHGIPLKKVGKADDKRVVSHSYRLLERAVPMFRPGSYPVLVSSETEREVIQEAFGQPRSRVHNTGVPRNDVLTTRRRSEQGLNIVYMPTHRGEGKGEVVNQLAVAAADIERRLEVLGATMYIKLHYYHRHEAMHFASERMVPVLDRPEDFDTYRFLNQMDILITDYSSVLFDWLLTDRPLVLFPYDLEDYKEHDREFNWDYDSIAAGPICGSWSDVVSEIEALDRTEPGADEWAGRRAEVRSRFHDNPDGQACARVVSLVQDMLRDSK